MNYKKIYNQQGFSLIEIMVAILILTVTFISLMYSFPFGLSITKGAENATIASYLAQDKIEELHSLGYDNIGVGTIEIKHQLSADPSSYLYSFQRKTVVDYVDGDLQTSVSDLGLKRISATIYYINAVSKTEKSYNMTTLISQR